MEGESAQAAAADKGEGVPSVSSSGTLSLDMPLELPGPRGNLSLPFSISYDGTTWDAGFCLLATIRSNDGPWQILGHYAGCR
jgi:hypothetical protein